MRLHIGNVVTIVVIKYYRLASLAGIRFNASGTQERLERRKASHITYPTPILESLITVPKSLISVSLYFG